MAFDISKKITLENKKKNLSKFYPQKNNLLSKLISLIFDYFHSIKISIHNFKLFFDIFDLCQKKFLHKKK